LIDNVAVEPTHRGQGIGRALLQHAEQIATTAGLPELRLYTNAAMVETWPCTHDSDTARPSDVTTRALTACFSRSPRQPRQHRPWEARPGGAAYGSVIRRTVAVWPGNSDRVPYPTFCPGSGGLENLVATQIDHDVVWHGVAGVGVEDDVPAGEQTSPRRSVRSSGIVATERAGEAERLRPRLGCLRVGADAVEDEL
jgi:predicted GNAT family acetyltransferase